MRLFLISGVVGIYSFLFAQNKQEVFTTPKIFCYGIDYSNVRFIGSGFDAADIKNRFFKMWNELIYNERYKYDLKEAFYKTEVEYDFSVVDKRNQLPDPEKMVVSGDYNISEETIAKMIAQYDPPQESGVGMVFVMEALDQPKENSRMFVVFFDIATKQVLLAKRMTGQAIGAGVRNYWGRSIYEVVLQCPREYKKWQKDKD